MANLSEKKVTPEELMADPDAQGEAASADEPSAATAAG
jgi:hypothetical protein